MNITSGMEIHYLHPKILESLETGQIELDLLCFTSILLLEYSAMRKFCIGIRSSILEIKLELPCASSSKDLEDGICEETKRGNDAAMG